LLDPPRFEFSISLIVSRFGLVTYLKSEAEMSGRFDARCFDELFCRQKFFLFKENAREEKKNPKNS
jgi:hypothetical protein